MSYMLGFRSVLRERLKGTFERRGTRERGALRERLRVHNGAYLSLAFFAIKNAIHHRNGNVVQLRRSN